MVPSQRVDAAVLSTYHIKGNSGTFPIVATWTTSVVDTFTMVDTYCYIPFSSLYNFSSLPSVVPDDCHYIYIACSFIVSESSLTYSEVSCLGVSGFCSPKTVANGYYSFALLVPVIPGTPISMDDWLKGSVHILTSWGSTNLDLTRRTSFTFSAPYTADFTFLSDSDISVSDLQQQTDQLTNGFDNSQGNAAADQLGNEINNYIEQEDALYDQMQYEVPEVDIASDGQAIMLASNFMQSLYVSDSFVSKCVTFVLTFGLIMYIIGWLKKKSG